MPVIFLECHELTLPILERAHRHWAGFGVPVYPYTRERRCVREAEYIEWLPTGQDPERFWSARIPDGLFISVRVGEQLVGVEQLPDHPVDVCFVRRIEYHRLDASYVRRPLLKSLHAASTPLLLKNAKLYCTVGKYLQEKIPRNTALYWRILLDLERQRFTKLARLKELSPVQALTLLERILVYDYPEYEKHRDTLDTVVESVRELPESSFLQGLLAFHTRDLESAREYFQVYLDYPPLPLSYDYEYEIYLRELAVKSFLFRLGLIVNDYEVIETHGREVFRRAPTRLGYEANRTVLRSYLHSLGLGYDDIDPATEVKEADFEPFFVYSQPRSGSTLLVQELNSHPEIDCFGELLSGEEPLSFLGSEEKQLEYIARRELDAARLAYDTLSSGSKTCRGLKIHGAQLPAHGSQPDLWAKLIAPAPKIVYLHRRPDLQRVLSLGLAFENESFRAHPEFVLYDRLEETRGYEQAVQRQEQEDARYLEAARAARCAILSLDMHEYLRDRAKTHRRICEFLGVKYAPLKSNLRKQNSWSLTDLLAANN